MLSNRYNKKAQIFVISVVIAVTVALTTSYILLHYMFKEINPDQHLGNYQSAMIDAMAQGDKTMLYIDQASKMAVANAFDEYIYGNPQPSMNVEGGDTESKYCGSYVYKLWNVADKDCYPDYASQDFELSKLINSHLAELTYLRESNDEYLILDRILRENIDYRYSYKTGDGSTTIIATTSDEYDIDIFLNEKIATDSEILEYLSNKDAFSGQMIWPLAKNFQVASCFGYRGRISEMASLNHPGIDISAPKGTPVLAAASGTVERKLYPDWGKIVLDHGSGLKTAYIHMDTIADGINVGDKVEQGQIIGYVGGRGANSADDYSPHLHFEVVSTTVNLDADYKGVNAVVKGLYVNPICFFNEADIQQNVIFNMQSKACNSICSEDGSKCVAPESGDIANVPYKFCDVYTGIISQEGICPKSDKIDWKIIDVKLSSTTLTSDQTLKIDMDVENKDESCVSVKQDLKFITNDDDASRPDYTIQSSSVAVYKATDSERYKALNTIICKFSSDYDIVTKEQLAGNCVLWIPKSGTARYTLESRALDGNGHTEKYANQRITFSVRKVAVESYVPQTIPVANTAQLSASERSKFEKTKQNIENLNLVEYISEQALKEGVSKEIILGIITQESGGDMYAGSPAGAYGLMQVVKSTFDGTRFQNKCTWEEYKKDAQCQIRAGIAVLKQKNTEIQGRTLYYSCNTNCRGTNSRGEDGYWSSCSRGCSQTDCMGPVKKTYSGWDAALRRYNGGGDVVAPTGTAQTSGCIGWPDYEYVEKVLKYAAAWGYASSYDSQTKEEMSKGILGKYTVRPVFNVKINLDMELFDMLTDFSNDTVKECGETGIDRATCIKGRVDEFNKNLPQQHITNGVNLSLSCDEGTEMTAVNRFVEEINNCMMSKDDICQCRISPSDINMKIESSEDSTKISYYSSADREVHYSYFDYGVTKTDSTYWNDKNVKAENIIISKDGNDLLLGVSNNKNCGIIQNRFRLCLNTGYKYSIYDAEDSEIVEKVFKIPFAITIRDDIAPAPLVGLKYENLKHSKNSILLRWPKGKEQDIIGYNIYLSDTQASFSGRDIESLKDVMTYKSISATAQDYSEFISIDLNNPSCKLEDIGLIGGYLGGLASSKSCTFEYSAIDKTNTPVNIVLEKEKIYYLSSTEEFIYLIDGQSQDNRLQSDRNKFIAVTAVDIDGDEIDNVKPDERITLGQNLISVLPKDLLEIGFTEISDMRTTIDSRALILSWRNVQRYIDGTSINLPSSVRIRYKIYVGSFPCVDGGLVMISQLNRLGGGIGPYYTNINSGMEITSLTPGEYCIGVSTYSDNNLEYESVITKRLTVRTPIT